jgi:hypothetical protein
MIILEGAGDDRVGEDRLEPSDAVAANNIEEDAEFVAERVDRTLTVGEREHVVEDVVGKEEVSRLELSENEEKKLVVFFRQT